MKVLQKFRKAREGVATALTDARSTVAQIRASIAEAEQQIEALARRPLARADLIGVARADIDRRAEDGHVLLRQAARQAAIGQGIDVLGLVRSERDAAALLAAVSGDALLSAFEAELAALCGDDPGLTEAEREAETVRLYQAAFDLELLEEAVIRQGEAAGITIERRQDAHPAALLAPDSALPQ